MQPQPTHPDLTTSRRRQSRSAGFTLIEAALTMVIVGTGILAMVSAQQAYHIKNDWAQRTGTAQLLANELREITLNLPLHDPISGSATLGPEANEHGVIDWDDLDDFAGVVNNGVGAGTIFNPPINGLRQPIDNLDQWSQVIRVDKVWMDNLSSETPQRLDGSADAVRITVTVRYQKDADSQPQDITTLTWQVAR